MVSGQEPKSVQGSQNDVAEVVRRGQRRFTLRLGAIWVAVFIATTVLVAIGIVVRAYIHSRTPSLQSLRLPGLLLASLVGMEALLAGALALATLRSQRLRRQHGQQRDHLWTAVVHQLQRWFASLPSKVWVTVVAIAAVLVIVNVVGRLSVDGPADPWEPTASAQTLRLLTAAAVLLAGALTRTAFRRWRASRESDYRESTEPADIRVEPHARPVEVTVEPYRDNTRTYAVRLEPRHGAGILTLQMMTS